MRSDGVNLDVPALRINKVTVKLSSLPIQDLVRAGGFDALTSSDNTRLSMSGGVSRAIRLAGGEVIADEAQKLVPLKVGDVGVTSAGTLPARYVLHAVTLDREIPVRPSEQTIRLAAENVFGRCELLGVRRLAMPAIGAGVAQFPADRSARLIVEALAKHSLNPTGIEEVLFSLPDPNTFRSFAIFLERAISSAVPVDGAAKSTDAPIAARAPRAPSSQIETGVPPASPMPRGSRVGSSSHLPTTASATEFLRRFFGRSQTGSHTQHTEAALPTRPAASRPLIGNRYVLLEEIGRGGMAIVYLAWDIVLRQIVAVKTLLPGERMARERIDGLRREAALQIGLVHQGIVRLFNFEPWDSAVGPYIIMEYVSWSSGERWMAEAGLSRLPVQAVLRVGICLCDALAHAHGANVLHGDIKPSNVFVDPAADAAKLADFGIARAVGGVERNALVTRLIGTPIYMAPEQKLVGAKVGPRTDIYLLARTLADFAGATLNPNGNVEFPGDTATARIVPVLNRGMAREPGERPADAREFGRLLQDALVAA